MGQDSIVTSKQSDESRTPPTKDRIITEVSCLHHLLAAPFIVVVLIIWLAVTCSNCTSERASLTRLRDPLRATAMLSAISDPVIATYSDGLLDIHNALERVWKGEQFSSRARDLPRELKAITHSRPEGAELEATARKFATIEPHFQYVVSEINRVVAEASKKYPELGFKFETVSTEIETRAAAKGGLEAVLKEMKGGSDPVNSAAKLLVDDDGSRQYKDAVEDIEYFLWQKIRHGYIPFADLRTRKSTFEPSIEDGSPKNFYNF